MPDDVGAGLLRLARFVALGEDGDAHLLAGAVRQHGGAAHDLVGVAHVDAEAKMDFDGLVELGAGQRLEQAHAFEGSVETVGLDGILGGGVGAALGGHSRTSCGADGDRVASHVGGRAVSPAMVGVPLLYLDAHAAGGALDDLHRGVDVVGVEIGRFGLGDGADLFARSGTDLVAVGLAGTLVDAEGLAQEHGGRRASW